MRGFGHSICILHEYIHFIDFVLGRSFSSGSMSASSSAFTQSMPYIFIAFHHFCAHTGPRDKLKFEFPRQESEFAQIKRASQLTAHTLVRHADRKSTPWLKTSKVLAEEVLSPLLRIICPPLRQGNYQLLKAPEKVFLKRLSVAMQDLHVTFVQEKNDTGEYVFVMHPPIDQLIQFTGLKHLKFNTLMNKYPVRQMISHEIELATMRRMKATSDARLGTENLSQEKESSPSSSQRIDKFAVKATVARDFFGREIIVNDEDMAANAVKKEQNRREVRYVFHEGFSNAVRRCVTMKSLLQVRETI